MGIVVSSRQACNIFWHSVTHLNAICVLISSLQRLRPPEKRGVRWFSLFRSPAPFFPPSADLSVLVITYYFCLPFLSLLVPCSGFPVYFSCIPRCPGRVASTRHERYLSSLCPCLSSRVMTETDPQAYKCVDYLFIRTFLCLCLETQVYIMPACCLFMRGKK